MAGILLAQNNSRIIGIVVNDHEKYDGYFPETEKICNLTIDNYDGGYQVGKYLERMGHKKVLCPIFMPLSYCIFCRKERFGYRRTFPL